jgi:hypothetical protein
VAREEAAVVERVVEIAIQDRRHVVGTGLSMGPDDLAAGLDGVDGPQIVAYVSRRDIQEPELRERSRNGDRGHAGELPEELPVEIVASYLVRARRHDFRPYVVLPDVRRRPVAPLLARHPEDLLPRCGVEGEKIRALFVVVHEIEPSAVKDG